MVRLFRFVCCWLGTAIVLRQPNLFSRTLLVLATSALLLPEHLCSQQLALRTYNRSAGLASNYIFSVFQDRDGFMWFGTDRGVSMYGGRNFTNYSTANGLSANIVYSIFQSADGTMWFGTYKGGVCSFNGREFTTYSTQAGLVDSVVHGIVEDRFGRMYFQSASGTSVLHKDSITVFRSTAARNSSILFMRGGAIYSLGSGTLTRITPSDDHVIHARTVAIVSEADAGYLNDAVTSVLLRSGGEVWLGGLSSIVVLDINEEGTVARVKRTIDLPGRLPSIYALCEEDDSTVWAGTRIGLFRISGSSVRLYQMKEGIDPEFLQSMYRDHEGSLWLGTFGGGVKKLSNDHITFYTLESGFPASNIATIFCDTKDNIWLGGTRFLGMLDPDGDLAIGNNSFSEVRAIAEDPSGKILVGTFEFLYGAGKREDYRRKALRERGLRIGGGISTVYFDSTGGYWTGSYGAGAYYFRNGKSNNYGEAEGMPSMMVEGIGHGYNAVWFLSRDNGATRLKNGRFERFSIERGLPSKEIYSVLEDSTTIWFGTGNGLVRMRNKRVDVINQKEGLQGKSVLWIGRVKGAADALWVLTENSLHQLREGTLRSFGSSMLRPSPTASVTHAAYRLSDNSLWVATTGGVSRIDLDEVGQKSPPPSVKIMRMYHDTTLVFSHIQMRAIAYRDPTILDYDQNNLSVSFAGLSYVDEEDVRYRFKLEPLEKDWSPLTRERDVRYRNLDDGNYTFSVLAINGRNVISTSPASISFTIMPPFWERWWFLVFSIVVMAGSFGGVVRYISVRKLRKKVEELEHERSIQAERERISRDLHDHVGAQLVNIISGLDLVGKYSPSKETRTQRLLRSLQQDARSSMLQLRETIWAMKTQSMTMEKFTAQVEEYSRRQMELQEDTELSCASSCDPSVELTPTQALHSFRFVQEALTNCMKHAKASHIRVTLSSCSPDRICIAVKDDGIGLQSSGVSGTEGNGVNNMRRRAEDLGGTFSIEACAGAGTEVRFEIPVKTAAPRL